MSSVHSIFGNMLNKQLDYILNDCVHEKEPRNKPLEENDVQILEHESILDESTTDFHNEYMSLICKTCGKQFISKESLKHHMKILEHDQVLDEHKNEHKDEHLDEDDIQILEQEPMLDEPTEAHIDDDDEPMVKLELQINQISDEENLSDKDYSPIQSNLVKKNPRYNNHGNFFCKYCNKKFKYRSNYDDHEKYRYVNFFDSKLHL